MRSAPAFSVKRPITICMLVAIAMLLGTVSLMRLPINLLPDIEAPTLTISVDYENASPQTMEQLVTRIIEQTVASTPGLEEMMSTSSKGSSRVRLQFAWGTDIDAATNAVRDRLFSEIDNLPQDADRPKLRKFDSTDLPIMVLGLSSQINPIELRRLIDNQISYRVQQVPGVAGIDIWGGPEREIQVNLDIDQVRELGLSLVAIRNAIAAANVNLPAGSIEIGQQDLTLRTRGRFDSLDGLRDAVVLTRNGAPIRLGQIATIRSAQQQNDRLIRINGEPGIRMAVRKQSGANTVEVSERLTREVERIAEEFPQVGIAQYFNTADFIRRSITGVSSALIYGSALAILVLLVFLGNVRAALVAGVAIPVSLIATFALMYGFGFTINLMTLGGLALGVGLMVDSAIVVLENILRRRREFGENRLDSAVRGANEIAGAIIASTLTTVAIFLPLLFARELAGQLFRDLAIVVGFALLCSLIVALTVVPMLTARTVQLKADHGNGLWHAIVIRFSALYDRLHLFYRRLLEGALAAPRKVLAAVVVVTIAALAGMTQLGTEFMPSTDQGEVRVDLEMLPGTRLGVVDRQARAAEAVIREVIPNAESVVTSVEGDGEADMRIGLPALDARSRTSREVAADLREAIGTLPGTDVGVRVRQPFFLRMLSGGGEDAESLQIEVRGYSYDVLDQLARRVENEIRPIAGITDVRTSRTAGAPQRDVVIDRDRPADLGVTVQAIGRTVETAIAGSTAGYFIDTGDEVRIRVKLANNRQMTPADILDLPVPAASGERVRLGAVADIVSTVGPVEIERKNQQRLVTVYGNIAGRDLGSVVAEVQNQLDSIALPANYDFSLEGEYEAQAEAFRALGINVLLALLLVYMVMACLYESLRDPLIVMVSVPLALIGVVLALGLTGTTLNAQSLLGCIILIGIVVNNAILIVDQANDLRRGGHMPFDAVLEAGRRRLRPVLMTAATTAFAMLPLALSDNAQAALARAVIGGLTSSTLVTLVIIPVVYAGAHRAWPPLRERTA